MAISHKFNPKCQYVTRKEFRMAGVDYKPGDLIKPKTNVGRLRTFYEEGYIWYGWQQARHVLAEKEKAEKKAATKARKDKEREKAASEVKAKEPKKTKKVK